METIKMIDLIKGDLEDFAKNANKLDVDAFTTAVYESFAGPSLNGAYSHRHYVILVPVSLDMYYDYEQHKKLEKFGFCQEGPDERYHNLFFATDTVVNEMVDILKYEGMTIDKAYEKHGDRDVYVVTLSGIANSDYLEDYPNEKDE